MPIYEYECGACHHQMEALQKMSDPALKQCPACGKDELAKKISAAGFRLAGSGWYETDFKSGKKKNLAGDSNAAAASGNSSGSSNNSSASASAGSSSGSSAGI